MNVSGVSNNGKVQKEKWEPIEPIQNMEKQGVLTGKNLSSGRRLDVYEIKEYSGLSVKIDKNKPVTMREVQPDHYLRSSDQYLGVFEKYAKGEISEYDFEAYSFAFGSTIKNTLQTNTMSVSGLNALVEEMKENISKGIANTSDNLKTELTAGGLKLTWKELMNLQKTGEYIDKFFGGATPGSYDTYAKIGIARAYIYKSDLS